ncbi:hypothetical protein CA54_28640 [Symmachiella macrocystis]|uniref:Uncharacterized protein n=1 Tax=Symmachiella macrocystis TaxID=2527985 RepID=A0A5C6BQP4_9PLAN|nr:hypothetical protein CA54_28640 [Symmachiella macrocystis]
MSWRCRAAICLPWLRNDDYFFGSALIHLRWPVFGIRLTQ